MIWSILDILPENNSIIKTKKHIYDGQKLTGAKRREFSGMIAVITSFIIIPATPSNPSIPCV
jgi:hypothetical protein